MSKILFFHPKNDFTGSTRVLANIICSEYADKQLKIITINNSRGFLSELPNVNIISLCCPHYKNKRIPILTGLTWRLHAWLLTIFIGWAYDTFYINTILPYYAAVIGCLYNKNIVYHIHEKFILKSFNIRIFEFIVNHVKAKRIFVSKYVKEQYPVNPKAIDIVKYNGIPKSFTEKVKIRPIEERNRSTVIMITSLSRSKGIFTYIETAKKMPEYNFILLVSSDISSINKFLGNKLPQNIKLIPAQNNIHPFLYSSDLVVNLTIPSLSIETFGMTVLEAMAYGIPAIVPNVGGPTEIVTNDYNGFCIDVCNIDTIIETIRYVFEEKEYNKLANNALKKSKDFII